MIGIAGPEEFSARIYSGNTPTPFYMAVHQMDIPTIPLIPPRAESEIILDGGAFTAFSSTVVTDPTAPFMPVEISFRVAMMPAYRDTLNAYGNIKRSASWTVGGDVWTPVTTASAGTRLDVRNVAQPCVLPSDQVQLLYCITYAWQEVTTPSEPTGDTIYGVARGIVINSANRVPDGRTTWIEMTGMCYGEIGFLTDWPAGTESVPS